MAWTWLEDASQTDRNPVGRTPLATVHVGSAALRCTNSVYACHGVHPHITVSGARGCRTGQ